MTVFGLGLITSIVMIRGFARIVLFCLKYCAHIRIRAVHALQWEEEE